MALHNDDDYHWGSPQYVVVIHTEYGTGTVLKGNRRGIGILREMIPEDVENRDMFPTDSEVAEMVAQSNYSMNTRLSLCNDPDEYWSGFGFNKEVEKFTACAAQRQADVKERERILASPLEGYSYLGLEIRGGYDSRFDTGYAVFPELGTVVEIQVEKIILESSGVRYIMYRCNCNHNSPRVGTLLGVRLKRTPKGGFATHRKDFM